MTAEELIHEMPKGLMKWYEFQRGAHVFFITTGTELDNALIEMFQENGLCIDCRNLEELGHTESEGYEYAVIADALEHTEDVANVLRAVYTVLKKNGILFLCVGNRFGIRYFCGDRDPFTGRNFDGIENYRRIGTTAVDRPKGRMYTKAELTEYLECSGFNEHRFYSVFPDISSPQIIFAEDYEPTEELKVRIDPQYHTPDTVFLEEEDLYTSLVQNGMFHAMANGFLIECPKEGNFSDANQITVSLDRGKENSLYTIIRRDGKVEKRSVYEEGNAKPEALLANNIYLSKHGVNMIDAEIVGNSFVMPYIKGVPLTRYFRRLAETDRQEFYRQFDLLWGVILSSSEHVRYEEVDWEHFDPRWGEEKNGKKQFDRSRWRRFAFEGGNKEEGLGVILKRGYIDLVLLNGFAAEDGFVFYDQEFYVSHLPAKAIMLRNINFLYQRDPQMHLIIPKRELIERYHISEECREICQAYIRSFLKKLLNKDILKEYHELHRRKYEVIHSNRQRMNYSAVEYQRLFIDIFKNIENRKLYLFGSGRFAEKFLALYQNEYEIENILDNDESKWEDTMEGIQIVPPSILKEIDPSTYKVIICIKNYLGVLKQVKDLGAANISIYDTNMEYSGKRDRVALRTQMNAEKKKYHVGYVAGVFDLFHIGHLNLLRRAKEQCDYLIAGVVTDEGVRKRKRVESFIPFQERLEIVKSCKYVDEAVGIPYKFCDTQDAYLRFQFDVQFSGSDYSDDPVWQKKRNFLREHGAELVFFPYTESTSSTRIKKLIEQKLV